MSKGLNKVFLSGYMGNNPTIRYTSSGDPQTLVSLCTNGSWTNKETGKTQGKPEWHRLILYKTVAEVAYQHLKKGSRVFIEGSLRTRKFFHKKDQMVRYSTEVVVHTIQFLDSKQKALTTPDNQSKAEDSNE